MSAAYAILTKNRCVFGGRAGTSLMVCSQTPVSTVTPEAGLAGQLFCKGGDKVMKKAVRKGASKAAALVLSLAMIFGMVPLVGASAEETAGAQDNFDRIVHLDMGRKYFTPEWIKSLIDEMAKLGYNQLELDFGNSEAGQLRFALDDMSVTYTYDEYTMVPVDSVSEEEPAAPAETGAPEEEPAAPAETGAPEEEPAAPAGTGAPEEEPAAPVSDEVLEQAETNGNGSGVIEYRYSKTPKTKTIDLSKALSSESPEGEYITEEQMAEIITYANEKDIEIVPLLNSPGHFGAVLCAADVVGKNYRYQRDGKGTNSLNIADPEAQAFGLAVVEKYAAWFAEHGCTTFNIGADEFANDDGTMGFNEFNDEMWSYFDSYITGLYDMLTDGLGYTTVRMFNDGVNYTSYYGKHTSSIPKDIEICYWSCGWDGYDVASADELASLGYSLINTNGDYYFVLKTEKDNTKMQYRSEEECLSFDNGSFMGSGNIGSSAGSMFCIWCDEPDNASQEEIMEAVKGPMTAVAYQMQGGESGTGLSYEQFKLSAVDSLTDRATGVTVSVDGLKTVEVKKQEKVDALENNALYSDYAAYDITLNDGVYKDEAQVTIPLDGELLAAESLVGFVVEDSGTVTTFDGDRSGNSFTFTAPHFSTVGVAALAAEPQKVTITEGDRWEMTVDGVLTEEDITSLPDSKHATVELTPAPGSGDSYQTITDENDITNGAQYLLYNIQAEKYLTDEQYNGTYGLAFNTTTGEDAQDRWTITSADGGYYIQNSAGQYLALDDKTSYVTNQPTAVTLERVNIGNSWNPNYVWDISYGTGLTTAYGSYPFHLNDINDSTVGGKGHYAGGYADEGSSWSLGGRYYYDNAGADRDEGSRWRIEKVIPGEDPKTTITFTGVSAGDTTAVIDGTIYNIHVIPNLNVDPLTVEYWITNGRPTDDNGNNFYNVEAVSANSEAGIDVSAFLPVNTTKENRTLQYWRCRLLETTRRNESTSRYEEQTEVAGDDETYSGTGFTKVRYWEGRWSVYTENNEWVEVENKHQLVAYYLEILPVADELLVNAADWGKKGDGTTAGDYLEPQNSCTVSVRVVYEDGTSNPEGTDAANLRDRTIAYGYWDGGRGIGTLRLNGLEGYQIWKVEAETGSVQTNSTDVWGNYYVTNFTWDNNPKTVYEGDPVDSYTIHNDANNPNRSGYYQNLMWDEKHEAILITVYVKAPVTEDALTVHYIDRTANNQEFYSYNINVVEGTLFDPDFALDPDYTDIDQALSNNGVKNTQNVDQFVPANLGRLTEIGAEYRYSDYRCVEAVRSADGKDVYLYYTFNNTHSFVVDFGLPVTITTEDLNISGNWTSASVSDPAYGTATADTAGMTYEADEIIKGIVTLRYTLTGSEGGATHVIYLIPASTVYYEAENFVDSDWDTNGTPGNRTQAADKLGDPNANNYGSDTSYDSNALGSSNGAALMTEVTPTAGTGEDIWPEATFTFTGTGVDIISQTDSASTWLLVEVKNDKSEPECAYLVNNYYSAENDGVNTIYQVPVIKVQGLDYGTYNVTVKPFYDTNEREILAVDGQMATEFNFYLDAIRVYNPLENGNTYYGRDGEANAQFINLSKYVTSTENGLWVDENTGANVNTYKDDGPNNEIYLASGQSVTIKLVDSEGKPIAATVGKSAQIGARLMNGTNDVQITVGGQTITVDSTVDQYYEVTGGVDSEITITNNSNGSGIVALTTLKLTGGSN